MLAFIKTPKVLLCITGGAILSFGLYNIHDLSGVTEGGILGMTLLLQHLFNISPAVSSLLMNTLCYFIGWQLLGKAFLVYSLIAGGSFSLFYAIFEQFPPLWPQLEAYPLIAALAGALFVGVGAGLCIRSSAAPGGDEALVMVISKITSCDIRYAYFACDLVVLTLSLCYLDTERFLLSMLTVTLSGQLVGIVQKFKIPKELTAVIKG